MVLSTYRVYSYKTFRLTKEGFQQPEAYCYSGLNGIWYKTFNLSETLLGPASKLGCGHIFHRRSVCVPGTYYWLDYQGRRNYMFCSVSVPSHSVMPTNYMFQGPQREPESQWDQSRESSGMWCGKNISQLVQTLESAWLCLNPSSDTNDVVLGKLLNYLKRVGDGQGSLACYSSWGCKESDITERLNSLTWSLKFLICKMGKIRSPTS